MVALLAWVLITHRIEAGITHDNRRSHGLEHDAAG
jgi:hypothetical protein